MKVNNIPYEIERSFELWPTFNNRLDFERREAFVRGWQEYHTLTKPLEQRIKDLEEERKWIHMVDEEPEHREKVFTCDHVGNVNYLLFIKGPLMESNYFEYEDGDRNYNIVKWQYPPSPPIKQ